MTDDTVKKRYFTMDDDGAWYVVVATDLEHARRVLMTSGVEFCEQPAESLPELEASGRVTWDELEGDEVAGKRVCMEDGRHVPLTECSLGDWFCSEY
jgi:hypothetical protein